MGKGEELTTTKYLIYAEINANGIVEKPDVVGAVFGQTEGLLSNDLDLRELQRTGRIGRIQVIIHANSGRAKGEIVIPSSLDRIETAILAASLETINRVGPCEAKIKTTHVEDVRAVKRQQVVNRAKEIYKGMMETVTPANMKMIEEVRESMRVHEISEYGDEKLPAGPNIHTSDAIIVVEGRSDVLNLLKYGIKNTVAVEGVNVPQAIGNLSKKRTTTVFVDGDRGGELILKELLQIGDIDYITRAPKGKEVEDLEKEEIFIALRDKVPTEQFLANNTEISAAIKDTKKDDTPVKQNRKPKYNKKEKPVEIEIEPVPTEEVEIEDDETALMKDMLKEIEGSGTGTLLDQALNVTKEVKVEEIYDELKAMDESAETVIFDGIISQRLVDISSLKGVKNLVAFKSMNIVKKPDNLKIITMD
ncbi:DNA primase DnaG [Methanobrevibacter sp. DSM 116169]|uniref:DNA primase DnaG n=1 Tax=Methanobrevibacter sp. DSM 116169 TaxID=3242727 RepID=UPI0038FCB166